MKSLNSIKTLVFVALAILVTVFTAGAVDASAIDIAMKGATVISLGSFAFMPKSTFEDYLKHLSLDGETYKKESAEKQSNIFKDFFNGMMKAMGDAISTVTDSEEIKALKLQIKALEEKQPNEADKEKITKEITRLAAELKALQEVGKPTNKVTFISAEKAIKDQYDEYLKASSKEQDRPFRFKFSSPFTTKDAVVVSVGNTVYDEDSGNHINVTRNTGIVSTIRERIMTYLQNVNTRITPNVDTVNWMEEVDEQGAPIFIAEGADKTQLSVRYEEREARAKVIAVYGKVTTKLMRNLPSLVGYIQRNLIKRLDVITENKLFLAVGSGNDPEGIVQYATAFDGGVGVAGGEGLVGKVHSPNVADVIRAASLQVYNSYGIPSAFWVTPDVVAQLDTMKSEEDGHYILPPFRSADGTVISGVRLIPTNALSGASIDFIGGDLSVINVDFTDQISVEIDRDGNDFTKNLKTILVEQELVQYVSANDTQVLIKGTFDAAMAIIEKPTT